MFSEIDLIPGSQADS